MNVAAIQDELSRQGLDGWLFFDHHIRDPLAYRVLRFQPVRTPTRRWYYLVPSQGERKGLVHRIESRMLDALPRAKLPHAGWGSQTARLKQLLKGCRKC